MQDPSSDHTENDLSEEPKQKLQMNRKKTGNFNCSHQLANKNLTEIEGHRQSRRV